jgi:hypothetical protein
VDALVIVLFCAGVLVFVFWVEMRVSKIEHRARSRDRHPAGSVCPDCHVKIADWDAHRRLAHQARVRAPEDSW